MTILIDDRTLRWMSKSFVDRFGGLGVVTRLEYGDMVFWAGKDPVSICVEVKRPGDILDSLVHTGRLIQQRRVAASTHHQYVLIEYGDTGIDPATGYYAVKARGGWAPVAIYGSSPPSYKHYRDVDNFLNTQAILNHTQVKRARNELELVRQVVDLYLWWQKGLEEHSTAMEEVFYTPVYMPGSVSLVRRWAKELPGLGGKRARAVELVFPSALEMVEAGEKEWQRVEGVGKTLAKRVWQAIRKREGGEG